MKIINGKIIKYRRKHFAFEYNSASDIHKKYIGRRSLVKISGIY